MAVRIPTRICTLCHTPFTPRTGLVWTGCGACFLGTVATFLTVSLARPGLVLSLGVCASSAVLCGWFLQRVAMARERSCTICGSHLTVPLLSPVGISLHLQSAPMRPVERPHRDGTACGGNSTSAARCR